jgi:uncharacterized protein (TIGR03437 family)
VTAPQPTISSVVNAASYVSGHVSPGEIITLFGTNIGPAQPVGLALDQNGKVATAIGGVQVVPVQYNSGWKFVNGPVLTVAE